MCDPMCGGHVRQRCGHVRPLCAHFLVAKDMTRLCACKRGHVRPMCGSMCGNMCESVCMNPCRRKWLCAHMPPHIPANKKTHILPHIPAHMPGSKNAHMPRVQHYFGEGSVYVYIALGQNPWHRPYKPLPYAQVCVCVCARDNFWSHASLQKHRHDSQNYRANR